MKPDWWKKGHIKQNLLLTAGKTATKEIGHTSSHLDNVHNTTDVKRCYKFLKKVPRMKKYWILQMNVKQKLKFNTTEQEHSTPCKTQLSNLQPSLHHCRIYTKWNFAQPNKSTAHLTTTMDKTRLTKNRPHLFTWHRWDHRIWLP